MKGILREDRYERKEEYEGEGKVNKIRTHKMT